MNIMKLSKLLTVTLGLITGNLYAENISGSALNQTLAEPISQTGTITFELHTDKTYFNGQGQENYSQNLVKLPGVMDISFRRVDEVVNLSWTWKRNSKTFYDIIVDFSELPGPETYFLQYTWDSALGRSEAYINGQPLRVPGAVFAPWWVEHTADNIIVGSGSLKVENLVVSSEYTPPQEALAAVDPKYTARHTELTGPVKMSPPIDISKRSGKVLYQSRMDTPESVKGWVKEGPVHIRFTEAAMLMRSVDFSGHIVFWCPENFPDSFVAEWEFQPLSHYGLAIVFFAAKGEQGQDIFDPALEKRDGNFIQYIKGDINSYHISYFANIENFQMGRTDSNLRKNNHFYRVGSGSIAIKPDSKRWHQIRLVKDGNRIQLSADGEIKIDWTDDDPQRYGPPHKDGKIGFRQMAPTIGCYKNFHVWALQ